MGSIDWNSELARIEREFDRRPTRPTPAELRKKREVARIVDDQASATGVWARLILVAALAAALPFWPYARECGTGLFTFIAGGGMIVIGGLWTAVCSWRQRMPVAHALTFVLIVVGLATAGHPILQRTGYARVDLSNPPHWSCEAPGA